jgi:hypothetical protein
LYQQPVPIRKLRNRLIQFVAACAAHVLDRFLKRSEIFISVYLSRSFPQRSPFPTRGIGRHLVD